MRSLSWLVKHRPARNPGGREGTPWVNYLESFRAEVADSFIASPEFQGHFASLFR